MSTEIVLNAPQASRPRFPIVTDTNRVGYPKWFGGSASCLAVMCTHPLDLIKVRLQATPPAEKGRVGQTIIRIIQGDGWGGLYRGLSAGILRQLTYGSTRFAIYESLKERATIRTGDAPQTAILLLASTFSGACGAVVGNPADIANVRMQNDRSLPANLRQNYRGVLDALARIARADGFRGFFRGVVPNSVRAGAMTGCQLGSYDWIKQVLVVKAGFQDGVATQLLASVAAGLIATTLCNPVDVIKTRSMSQRGSLSPWGIVNELSRFEGVRWVLRGWLPSFARLGPHTAATLLFLEQHRKIYDRYRRGGD